MQRHEEVREEYKVGSVECDRDGHINVGKVGNVMEML